MRWLQASNTKPQESQANDCMAGMVPASDRRVQISAREMHVITMATVNAINDADSGSKRLVKY